MTDRLYHVGFAPSDLDDGTTIALLSGDPERSEHIATERLDAGRELSRNRGLDAFAARLPGGAPVVCATSGMGAPSMSIVVNELFQAGIRTIIRIGTSGSIQDHVRVGSVVIGSGSLTNQGAANDIAPPEFPAVADPYGNGFIRESGSMRQQGVLPSIRPACRGPAFTWHDLPSPLAAPRSTTR